MLIEFICEKQEEKLLRLISSKYPELSFNKINMLLRKRDIRINGKRIQENVSVKKDDTIQLYISSLEDKKNTNINIFYEDSNILIAEKPQDIEVEGANSLTEILKEDYPFLKPCHRLDRNTTGLLVYAVNEKAYSEVLKAFNDRTIEKYYLALLCGYLEEKKARLNAYLFKDSRKSKVYISDKQGKGYLPITTEYRVLQEFNNLSLVEINLITGRTHQIRAHMAFIGHPVLGDGKYGTNEFNKIHSAKSQQLYAYKIKFNFPKNSSLRYLNDINFDNRLYEKDLQEYNTALEDDTVTLETLPEIETPIKQISEIDEFIKSNGGGDGKNYGDKRAYKNNNRQPNYKQAQSNEGDVLLSSDQNSNVSLVPEEKADMDAQNAVQNDFTDNKQDNKGEKSNQNTNNQRKNRPFRDNKKQSNNFKGFKNNKKNDKTTGNDNTPNDKRNTDVNTPNDKRNTDNQVKNKSHNNNGENKNKNTNYNKRRFKNHKKRENTPQNPVT